MEWLKSTFLTLSQQPEVTALSANEITFYALESMMCHTGGWVGREVYILLSQSQEPGSNPGDSGTPLYESILVENHATNPLQADS